MDLKLMLQTALYKSFLKSNPKFISIIQAAKINRIPFKYIEGFIKDRAENLGTFDGGNNLVLVAEYIYNMDSLN